MGSQKNQFQIIGMRCCGGTAKPVKLKTELVRRLRFGFYLVGGSTALVSVQWPA
jgi:hypothetical protein